MGRSCLLAALVLMWSKSMPVGADETCGELDPALPCGVGGDTECECIDGQCSVWVKILNAVQAHQQAESGSVIESWFAPCQQDRRCASMQGTVCGGLVTCYKTNTVINTYTTTA